MVIKRRHRVPQTVEDVVLLIAAERPALGRARVAAELTARGLEASPATVRSVWQRHGLQTAEKRRQAFAPVACDVGVEARVVIPPTHEIAPDPALAPSLAPSLAPAFAPSTMAADALVFSIAVLSALGQDNADGLNHAHSDALDLPVPESTFEFAQQPVEIHSADILHVTHDVHTADFFVV